MIGFVALGLLIGLMARLFLPGPRHLRLVATLIIGVMTAVIAGIGINALAFRPLFDLTAVSLVAATLVPVAVLAAVERAVTRRM